MLLGRLHRLERHVIHWSVLRSRAPQDDQASGCHSSLLVFSEDNRASGSEFYTGRAFIFIILSTRWCAS